jgi:hypothetical protein
MYAVAHMYSYSLLDPFLALGNLYNRVVAKVAHRASALHENVKTIVWLIDTLRNDPKDVFMFSKQKRALTLWKFPQHLPWSCTGCNGS